VRWSPHSLFKWLAAPPSPQVNLASADASTAVGGHGEGLPWRGDSMGATENVGSNAEVQRILGLISCNNNNNNNNNKQSSTNHCRIFSQFTA